MKLWEGGQTAAWLEVKSKRPLYEPWNLIQRYEFFPNSNSFGAFSHSKGLGAELLSDSLWFSGGIRLGLPKDGVEGSTKVRQDSTKLPSRFHQASTKTPPSSTSVLQVSWCLALWGWAAKRFCATFHQGCAKIPPRLHQGSTKLSKFRGVSGSLADASWAAKGSAEGSTKVPPGWSGSTTVLQVSLRVWFSAWTCVGLQKVRLGLPKGSGEGSPRFTDIPPSLQEGCASFAKGFCGRFPHHFFTFASQFLQLFLAFSPNTGLGAFSHSQGFGPELLSGSLWWFSGAGRLGPGSTKVPAKEVPPRFVKFRGVCFRGADRSWAAKRLHLN